MSTTARPLSLPAPPGDNEVGVRCGGWAASTKADRQFPNKEPPSFYYREMAVSFLAGDWQFRRRCVVAVTRVPVGLRFFAQTFWREQSL